jgi:hypothetical protein
MPKLDCSQATRLMARDMLAAIETSNMPEIRDTIRPRVRMPVIASLRGDDASSCRAFRTLPGSRSRTRSPG